MKAYILYIISSTNIKLSKISSFNDNNKIILFSFVNIHREVIMLGYNNFEDYTILTCFLLQYNLLVFSGSTQEL